MKNLFHLLLALTLCACATQPSEREPLFKNTKKLVTQGHKSLYENGAFHIPNTSISLIPAGPSATEFALDLAGIRATQSFKQSLNNAADSVQIVSIGTRKTYEFSENIYDASQAFSDKVTEFSRPGGVLLMKRSVTDAKYISGVSWQAAKETGAFLWELGDDMTDRSFETAADISADGIDTSKQILNRSVAVGVNITDKMFDLSTHAFKTGKHAFIQGYAALPENVQTRAANMSPTPSWHSYADSAKSVNQWREDASDSMAFFVKDATDNYFQNIGHSFSKSKEALTQTDDTGTLAVLKSLGWALHGLVWEGILKPTAQITAGSIGYVAVNTVVYPVMLVGHGTVSLAEVAVKVTWNTGAMAYDFVAPTAKAAIAGILGTVEATGGVIAGGAVMTTGAAISGTTLVTTQATAATVATVGGLSGQTVKYVGVPLAASGVAVGGTAVGVAVGSGEAVLGASTLVGGEAVSLGAQATGTALSGVTLASGTVASGAAGIGYGMYQLTKAVVVPSGYVLGSGIVLSYSSISQLAAHSVLAVSDAAYLVLSLEGPVDAPKWVIYSVQDALGVGEELSAGTILDLEAMQTQGETFKRLPVSDDEMDAVIEHVPADLKTVTL